MRKLVASIFLFACTFAQAEVINFDSLHRSDDQFTFLSGDYQEAGYTFKAANPLPFSFASAGDLNVRFAGSTALTSYNFGLITLQNTSGAVFDFLSIDVAPVILGDNDPFGFNRDLNAVYQTTFYGLKTDGSIVTQLVTLPNDTPGNVLTAAALIDFDNIVAAAWENNFPGVQFDNLVLNTHAVSQVPVPAAAYLFISGLVGMLGMRRKYSI